MCWNHQLQCVVRTVASGRGSNREYVLGVDKQKKSCETIEGIEKHQTEIVSNTTLRAKNKIITRTVVVPKIWSTNPEVSGSQNIFRDTGELREINSMMFENISL